MTFNRTIVTARHALTDRLAKEFLPLEQSADATAVKGFRFLALTLEQRAEAARNGAHVATPVSTA